ncbi:DEAD/DEAH box helicase [Solimonas flava]|uniref:DEAD/DEAH box helicase n=1 Tax=Solimonas flava TaxID=415849 RepID=UPI0003FE62C7|nr:DEAD/DEAH box helicase [Solimonas flava]
MSDEAVAPLTFRDLALAPEVVAALEAVGYETPSPIQAQTIPHLLDGHDVLGMAQTGTGKTAAFALPILSRLDWGQRAPQALVLAPTRELAIQVAEAFQRYAANLPGFHVLPIYGGQAYGPQLAALRRGVHVVVGTPGRVLDHLKRGTLDLSQVRYLVLDEADEMLKMGFVEDIEAILQATPDSRQVALFSATMPPPIRRIAQTYLNEPVEVRIAAKTTTATNVRQRYWLAVGLHKLDALTRILEAEPFDGMIIFVRTKAETVELADKLAARGFNATALNGDMEQKARERVIAKLKNGEIDIVVATDIAARGIDVERVSHVVNYDIPTDPESYVHRIGRTGRAGRSGEAILFVAPRERHLLRLIERTSKQPVTPMDLPSVEDVNAQRLAKFKERIGEALGTGGLEPFRKLVAEYEQEHGVPALDIAAALGCLLQGDTPLLLNAPAGDKPAPRREAAARADVNPFAHDTRRRDTARPAREDYAPAAFRRPEAEAGEAAGHDERAERFERAERETRERRPARPPRGAPEEGMETFRIAVGHAHKVKPGNIVGAIANEAGLDSQYIGRVEIFDDYSLVDLPQGMPNNIFRELQKVWVCGRQLQIARAGETPVAAEGAAEASGSHPFTGKKPSKPRFEAGANRDFGKKPFERKPFHDEAREPRTFEKRSADKPDFEKKTFPKKSTDTLSLESKPFAKKSYAKPGFEKKSFGARSEGPRPFKARAADGDSRPAGPRKGPGGFKSGFAGGKGKPGGKAKRY